jgi:hypothetical protein
MAMGYKTYLGKAFRRDNNHSTYPIGRGGLKAGVKFQSNSGAFNLI